MTEKCPHCETELPKKEYKDKILGYRLGVPEPIRFICEKCGGWYYYRL